MAKDLSRRKFLKLMAGAGTIGMTVALTSGGENILTAKGEPPGGDGWIPDQYNGKGDFSLNLKEFFWKLSRFSCQFSHCFLLC